MKTLLRTALVAAVVIAVPIAAFAQGQNNLQLTMENGHVTLIAQDVPLRTILQEWARIGQTKIINGEKLAGGPVTLQLVNKSEREVLDILTEERIHLLVAQRLGAGAHFVVVGAHVGQSSPRITAAATKQFGLRYRDPSEYVFVDLAKK